MVLVIPHTVPVNVGDAILALLESAGTVGKSAVPHRSHASLTLPFNTVVASGEPDDTEESTYALTAFCDGYKILEVHSAVEVDLLETFSGT